MSKASLWAAYDALLDLYKAGGLGFDLEQLVEEILSSSIDDVARMDYSLEPLLRRVEVGEF